jgi:GntR family transcriptional repressor for pyruvate dehydrogenase complex
MSRGVSRTVVREAVQQLRSRGFLSSRQGDGVLVAQPPANRPLSFDSSVPESEAAMLQVAEGCAGERLIWTHLMASTST